MSKLCGILFHGDPPGLLEGIRLNAVAQRKAAREKETRLCKRR